MSIEIVIEIVICHRKSISYDKFFDRFPAYLHRGEYILEKTNPCPYHWERYIQLKNVFREFFPSTGALTWQITFPAID